MSIEKSLMEAESRWAVAQHDSPTFEMRDAFAQGFAAAMTYHPIVALWREHSVILNNILWRMSVAMGEVGEDKTEAFGEPRAIVDRFFEAVT